MRGRKLFLAAVLLLILQGVPSSFQSSPTAQTSMLLDDSGGIEPAYGVKITAVCSAFKCEFITLENKGADGIDLCNWMLTDGEGTLSFMKSIPIEVGGMVTVCSNASLFLGMIDACPYVEFKSMIESGNFVLADKGDEVILRDPDERIIDAVIYGDSDYLGGGWSGRAVERIARGKMIERIGKDTNESTDWRISSPGRSSMEKMETECHLEPFLIPDNGRMRILRELRYASRSVVLCMYELGDPIIMRALSDCARRGVEVDILLEGQPVAGLDDDLIESYQEMVHAGCNISLLRSFDGYKRYDYLHCKYAVIDGYRCIITSENWMKEALNSNRGWGAVAISKQLSSHLLSIFRHDSNPDRLDVDRVEAADRSLSFDSWEPESYDCSSNKYAGIASISLSPDYAIEYYSDLISTAKRRILVELMYSQDSWLSAPSLLTELRSAAKRGVTVRLLMDSSWFNLEGSKNNTLIVETINQWAELDRSDMRAKLITRYHDFEILHNKGLIVDDTSVISSMNWCESAIKHNRELGISFTSSDMASWLSESFFNDWIDDPIPPQISMRISPSNPTEDDVILLDATNCTDNAGISECYWDLYNDGTNEWEGAIQIIHLPSGVHKLRLVVIDVFNNSASEVVEIIVAESVQTGPGMLEYAPFILVLIVAPLWALRKMIKSR